MAAISESLSGADKNKAPRRSGAPCSIVDDSLSRASGSVAVLESALLSPADEQVLVLIRELGTALGHASDFSRTNDHPPPGQASCRRLNERRPRSVQSTKKGREVSPAALIPDSGSTQRRTCFFERGLIRP